ncbi:MAG: FtsX-like permease family protein [Gammaproteobacteria bacterium]|nr:FtsX-like permease family protein [Gammaproteobacteria bacterium]
MSSAVAFGLRRLRRGWRSGELPILALAIAVAVAAVGGVGLFGSRVERAIEAQSGEALGADMQLGSRSPLPPELAAQARALGAAVLETATLPSVIQAGERSTLAAVKAVPDGYPLRGRLRIADEPFAPPRDTAEVPAAGTAWADLRLWTELGLAPGAQIRLGAATLRIAALIEYEPDRGSGFVDIAPRLLMNARDLAATQLIQPGSRAQFSLLVAGPAAALDEIAQMELPSNIRRLRPADARAEVRAAMDRARRFLDLAVLAAALLAAAAVALCARSYGRRLRDEVALLKCLGARQNFVAGALASSLGALALLAGLAGAAGGYLAQELIATLLAGLMPAALPPPSPWPLVSAFGLGLLILLGFGLPAVLQARHAPPMRVFQRELEATAGARLVALGAVAGAAALLWLRTRDPMLAAYVLAGALGTLLLLAGAAWLLVRLLAPLRRRVGVSWRFGLANITRRQGSSIAQVVALGLALLALLLLAIGRDELLEAWRNRLKPDTPNQFIIDIQPGQLDALRQFFAAQGLGEPQLWPMARGRLVALNGAPVAAESFDDPETRRWINREFNLSWTDALGADNELKQGEWWGREGRGQPWLSAEDYAVERLKLKLGDRMTLQIADREIELTVRSFREVHWDSFRPNFFLLTPPGTLDDAPATWLTSFYLPKDRRELLRALLREFPNLTVVDLDAVMNQVRSIVDRVARAVEFIFLFALAAGLLVLLAAVEGTREERVREIGLLRALGARRRVVVLGLIAEYGVLGLLAGTVAAAAAQGLTYALAQWVFEIPYGFSAALWLAGAPIGGVLAALMGWLALRGTLRTPPRQVLAANGTSC